MERHGDEVELTTTEARAGGRPRSMKTVLLVSLALVVAIFAVIFFVGMGSTDNAEPDSVVKGQETPAA